MDNTQLPANFKGLVDPLHFLYWVTGYRNEVGEEIRLSDHRFCFCSEGEEPDPITSNGIIQLYFLHNPDKATEYATKLAQAEQENAEPKKNTTVWEAASSTLNDQANAARVLLEKLISRHYGILIITDSELYNEIKTFLDGK
jgi:hypothetical protein